MSGPLTDEQWDHVERCVSEALGAAFTDEPRGRPLHQLGVVTSLLAMLESSKFGKKANKSLAEYDKEARDVLVMRRPLLERMQDALSERDDVKAKLKAARARGVQRGLGSGSAARLRAIAQHLDSPAFYARVDALGEQARADELKMQALRLASLDPALAEDVAVRWLGHELAEHPQRVLTSISEAEAVRGMEDLLAFLAAMASDDKAMRRAQGIAGPKGATLPPATALYDLISAPASRRAMARGLARALRSRSYHSALGVDDAQLLAKLKADNVPGAALLDRVTQFSPAGRGITTFFSLWGLAAVTECFPPVDDAGRVRWSQLAMSGSSALSITSNAPDIAKFFSADLRPLYGKTLATQFVKTRVGGAVCRGSRLAQGAKFGRLCKVLGPVGDAIALPFTVRSMVEENDHEDRVGEITATIGFVSAYAGLTGGLLMLGSTGVGLPIAVVAAGVGIVAALVNAGFGESALTGQIREDLRYLGISTAEHDVCRAMTTDPCTVTRSTGLFGLGGKETVVKHIPVSDTRLRERLRRANHYERIQIINHALDGKTTAEEETLVWEVFLCTPYAGGEFLQLVESVDARRLANELEDEDQAAIVMVWTAQAYANAGRPPGRAFTEQLLQLCDEHRDATVNAFLDRVLEGGGDTNQLDRDIYRQIPPDVIRQGTAKLMSGHTGNGEERAIFRLLGTCSYTQFNAILETGGFAYLRRLQSELDSGDWKNFRTWMNHDDASPHVRHYNVMLGR